ncbi:hypothetical protein [Methylobacterium oryzisoli]|uniref:hypothetical protein n=1 Tax=Methylobacterium oryzisoli TaxID=3385502 RepID=UPI0038914F0F
MTRRYAEDTKVPVAQSRTQIEAMLRKAGAERVMHMDEPTEAVVMFLLAGRLIKLLAPISPDARDQERRRVWRALGLVIKAKLEATASGIETVESAWLAHVVLPDGQTVSRWIEPQLQVAYERGQMPTHPLLLEGPKA